jgi:tryptophan 2-monooxygenase
MRAIERSLAASDCLRIRACDEVEIGDSTDEGIGQAVRPGISFDVDTSQSDQGGWLPQFPNPADFRFNYFKLLQHAPDGLADASEGSPRRVAVVGAGCAGITVARELYRCGYQVTIFEASGRIGGRLYTVNNPHGTSQAGMEMGAMRMPFFAQPRSENSILDYYVTFEPGAHHPALLAPFPNPGAAPGGTGIYINRGLGPDTRRPYRKPTLISWSQGKPPQDPSLQGLTKKAASFLGNFARAPHKYYTQPGTDWSTCWAKLVEFYDPMTFDDLVVEPALSTATVDAKLADLNQFDGNLGGFGMSPEEADLLYTIGTGDGSWGAFYSIGALWFLRCTVFGLSTALQTIEGFGNPQQLPHWGSSVADSNGTNLPSPRFEGVQALVEYLFYVPAPGATKSLYEGARTFIGSPVSSIEKGGDELRVTYGEDGRSEPFDFVVVSSTQWAAQMTIDFVGFSEDELPSKKLTTQNTQHNISSCKLFFPLREKYWERTDNRLPQVIITDTYIQDVYALTWNSKKNDNGVLLASYTWEDDSLKLLPYDDSTLANMVLATLKEITTSTTGQDITQYIDSTKPVVIQWLREPSYIGCAKLYRAQNEQGNRLDLSYNQQFSKRSKLYFAGENYGVEGGWLEPALRSALDCVLQLLNNDQAEFKVQGFDFRTDYPEWP